MNVMSIFLVAAEAAEATQPAGPGLVERILEPDIIVFMIPITAIVVGGILAIVKVVTRHRERMAKIEMGIDPDTPPPTRDGSQGPR
jgi:hypothetical protein